MFESIGVTGELGNYYSTMGGMTVWNELIGNEELLNSQYDVVAGHMPENYDEIVLIVSKYNTIDDFTLYALGLKDQSELAGLLSSRP